MTFPEGISNTPCSQAICTTRPGARQARSMAAPCIRPPKAMLRWPMRRLPALRALLELEAPQQVRAEPLAPLQTPLTPTGTPAR